jgi:hypothetical protein
MTSTLLVVAAKEGDCEDELVPPLPPPQAARIPATMQVRARVCFFMRELQKSDES